MVIFLFGLVVGYLIRRNVHEVYIAPKVKQKYIGIQQVCTTYTTCTSSIVILKQLERILFREVATSWNMEYIDKNGL